MDKKLYKPLIIIISVTLVLVIGYLTREHIFKKDKVATDVKTNLAKQVISKQFGIPQEEVPVRAYQVSKVDYNDDLPVIGTIKSIPEIELKFQRNGVIDKFSYKESDSVKKGDVIAVLEQEDAKLEVEWADAKLKTAHAEANTVLKRLEVMDELYQTGALIKAKVEETQAQYEAAQKRIEQARVELKSAKVKLDKTYLYAPRDAILGYKEAEVGEFITPNDKIITLLDPDNLYAEVGIIEKDVGKIKRGQRAKVIVDSYQKQEIEFWGSIEQIFPNIESKSRTLTVRIKITSRKAKDMLLPGMFARVKIFIYSKKDAIVVPDSAVDLRSRPPEVSFVVDNKAVNRPISIDWVGTGYVVIKSGVNVGDIVIIETPGLKKLKQGSPIEVIETQTSIFE